MSARPRKKPQCSAPQSGTTPALADHTRGSSSPRLWSTTTTSTPSAATFGPFFLKFCTYFPYPAKLCLNGHEYAKRQLAREGIAFQALDNGVHNCADPQRLQQICDGLSAETIQGLLRKWLDRLPHPFTAADRKAGYRYEISILQAEFSLTQVLDRPVHGRLFFEQVICENLDLGRPEEVQLIFNRKVTRATPRRFRARLL